MTEEEIIRLGRVSTALLDNHDLQWFISHLKQLTLESIAQTKLDDSASRERLYLQFQSIGDLVGIMESYKDASKAILERNESERD